MNHPLVVILAGGLGTRLGPLAEGLPKPMVPVDGKPFLEHVVRQVAAQGFEEILLLVGHKAELIENHFGDGCSFGIPISYSREYEPLGTGGALALARPSITKPFLLLYGDLYRPVNYAELLAPIRGNALAVYPYTEGLTTIAAPNIGVSSDGDKVEAYIKDRPDLGLTHVDAGFGCFQPSTLDLLPSGPSNFEHWVYPALARQGLLNAIHVDRKFFDIGNPDDLAHARAHFGASMEG